MSADDVIYFDDERSASLFDGAEAKDHFWSLCRFFVSESHATYCGIASSVMILNSLGVASPPVPEIYPYEMFTQDNFFNETMLELRHPSEVEKNGCTLEQLATMLAIYDLRVETTFGDTVSLDEFRTTMLGALRSTNQRVIMDFSRKTFGQKGVGHISPLAAHNRNEDTFLLMDVARYKLPPCWVRAELLHRAMQDPDRVSGRARGFLIVGRP